jgi:hypothetical protein
MYRDLKAEAQRQLDPGSATVMDLSTMFKDTAEPVYDSDGVHYTPLGSQRLGQAMATAVKQTSCG